MNIECPECKKYNEIDGDSLPDRVCDDTDYECIYCEHIFSIGWYAEIELR